MNQILHLKQCSSTNDEILEFSPHLKKDRIFTLYTFNQTKGRGQYGNTWETIPNQNIAFSMAFPNTKILLSDNLFNFHTANILRKFIAKKTEKETKVKWPNDIILTGKKVSGMLIEKKKVNQEEFLILGIGINVLQRNFNHLPKAGSILTQTTLQFDLTEWVMEMNNFFVENLFTQVSSKKILEEYNSHLFKKNLISVFNIKGIRQNGIIKKVDEQGFLWVDLEANGLQKFYYKELELLY